MASLSKMEGGRWRAMVARRGERRSKVFESRQEAKDWAARQEYLILNREAAVAKTTFAECCVRFAKEVSPLRKGERWEAIRLKKLAASFLGKIVVAELTAADFAKWRDQRLSEVKPASVAREMSLMSSLMTQCRKEWGLIKTNPLADVRKPAKPPARSRIPSADEMEALLISAGSDLSHATARAFHAFRFACETAMRAGEIISLTWDNVDLVRRVAHLPQTKNGYARDVALSQEAVRLLKALPKADPVFDLESKSLDALWRKLRARAAVDGLTFHDSRRAGTTRMAAKLDALELAKMTGHRDLSMLLNTYYKADAAKIARKLD